MVELQKERIESEILIIGGGPAGLMAAIRASDLGAKNVLVVDKSNTLRSGNAGAGTDHFRCYIPEYHGHDPKPILEEMQHALAPTFGGASYMETWLNLSFEMVKLWDAWGIPMRYNGKWEFAGHAFPGRLRLSLKYAGGNQKSVLTRQARKRGVAIRNRITVFDLLKEGNRVVGAVGYDTWNDRLLELRAKAVMLATGGCYRLYKGPTSMICNICNSPFDTGDGRAMALRAGADLLNLELTRVWAGPKNFARCGKATWIGVYRDASGRRVGPFVRKPDKVNGDSIADAYPGVFNDYAASGRGPIYNDCRGASETDMDYMLHWLQNEGNLGLINHLQEEGIDPSKHPIEFTTYERIVTGGLWFSNNSRTSVQGLYAAGDENFGGMANAVVWGWLAGESMAKDLKRLEWGQPKKMTGQIEERAQLLSGMLKQRNGVGWEEANIAIQEVMSDYVGAVRSKTLLDQGRRNLTRIRQKTYRLLQARNGHELGRCLEVLNLIEVGEAVCYAASRRQETRKGHRRADFPFTNPLMDVALMVRKKDGRLVSRWKDVKR